MTPRLSHILLGASLAIALVGLIAWGSSAINEKIAHKAEIQAAVDKGKADGHAAAATAIPTHEASLDNAQAVVDQARAEVARLRKQLAANARVPAPSLPSSDPAPAAPVAPDLGDLVRSQGALIEAQDRQIGELKLALSDEVKRGVEWKAAFEDERRRATGLEIALAAQKRVSKSDRWLGRVEGLALGIGVGYVGSKL